MRTRSRRSEETAELTGFDAKLAQAQLGNGSTLYGADMTGGYQDVEDVSEGTDIQPDQIKRFVSATQEEEEEVTAQPMERERVDPSELP
jgi:hypothetical protein